jgi:hypothetical protein
MQVEKLRSLIRESINEYIKEIDEAAETAAMEARIAKCDEAIQMRESKLANLESLEEVKDMVDETKVENIRKEIKELQKAKLKFEKLAEKRAAKLAGKGKKKEVTTDAKTEDAPVDESDVMEKMEMEGDMPKEEALNESFLKMQKLAGVITEGQYRKKVQMLNEALEIEWSELGNDFTQAIQQVFGKTVKIQDAEVRYRPSSDTGKQPEFTFGVTIPSVGDKDNYKGALLYTNFLSDGNGFVGYDNYSKDKEATAEEFDKTLIPAWKKASAFVLGNLLKKPEELNKATIGGYKYEEKDLEDLKKYVASVPNLAIKKR